LKGQNMPARYLVTGGCGFIGSHLVDALIGKGIDVVVLDDLSTGRQQNLNPSAKLVTGDIRDRVLLESALSGCDGVFHLAAIASVPKCTQQWYDSHTVNLSASVSIFERAAELRIPVVYASSSAIYGDASRTPILEDDPKRPISAYGADKYAMELHAAAGANTRGLKAFGLRFFNIYGPRQDPSSPYSGVIAIFMKNAAEGKPLFIHGNGGQTRDFVHVSDAVEACISAMENLRERSSGASEISNVCTGHATTIRELAEGVLSLTSISTEISFGPARVGDIRASVGDPSYLISVLGTAAKVNLSQGLKSILNSDDTM
jgi:UDP-glucose 4-epimerase